MSTVERALAVFPRGERPMTDPAVILPFPDPEPRPLTP